jgi:putative colanic acid biosynthesis acetyltransferase WcaF
MAVDLSKYNNRFYHPGRSYGIRALWYITNALCFLNPLFPFSKLKVLLLRLFGAYVGQNVTIKPRVNIKYPWKLGIGDNSWIGEKAWFDCLAEIKVGNNVCISQGAYLCTGNHNWKDPHFGLIVKPIHIEDGAWIGAFSTILPGVVIASHTIITAGTVLSKPTHEYTIYSGNPAQEVKKRAVNQESSPQDYEFRTISA